MARLSKKQKEARAKLDSNSLYSIAAASSLVKEVTTTKFDASVDLAFVWVLIQRKPIKWYVA